MRGRALLIAAFAGLSVLAGCGEKPQTLDPKAKGPDVAPWSASASSPYYAAEWKGGDKAAWEAQIRTRNQGQNDYAR
jgi:hypothetical protein